MLRDRAPQDLAEIQLPHVELQRPAPEPRQDQEVLHQEVHPRALPVDGQRALPLFVGRVPGPEEELAVGLDGGEGRLQRVRGGAEEAIPLALQVGRVGDVPDDRDRELHGAVGADAHRSDRDGDEPHVAAGSVDLGRVGGDVLAVQGPLGGVALRGDDVPVERAEAEPPRELHDVHADDLARAGGAQDGAAASFASVTARWGPPTRSTPSAMLRSVARKVASERESRAKQTAVVTYAPAAATATNTHPLAVSRRPEVTGSLTNR